jgi:hypothetical protein
VRNRLAKRLTVIALCTVVPVLVSAGPALAKVKPDDGEVTTTPLGLRGVLLRFVVVPLGAFLVIAALAVLPSTLSRPRYRPGKPWDHQPRWIGGPREGTAAAAAASTMPDPTARGGASAEW